MPIAADPSVDYYSRNAARYFQSTVELDMSALYGRFLRYLPKSGQILDAGSGSGRDTLAFLKMGYQVSAFDASPEMAALSTELTGVRTLVSTFKDFHETEQYDGIWACASLLHVLAAELPAILNQLNRGLKTHGALYASFREGTGEHHPSSGRHFTDLTVTAFQTLLNKVPGLHLRESWNNVASNSDGALVPWLNVIAVRD